MNGLPVLGVGANIELLVPAPTVRSVSTHSSKCCSKITDLFTLHSHSPGALCCLALPCKRQCLVQSTLPPPSSNLPTTSAMFRHPWPPLFNQLLPSEDFWRKYNKLYEENCAALSRAMPGDECCRFAKNIIFRNCSTVVCRFHDADALTAL